MEDTVEAYTVRDYRTIEVDVKELDVSDFTRYDYVVIKYKDTTLVINCREVQHVLATNDKVEVKMKDEKIFISKEGIRITP